MPQAVADVLLITDDGHLREAVARHQRPGARLQSISRNELTAGKLPESRQVWLDLESSEAVPAAGGVRRVYFHSQHQTLVAKLPPGLFIRKPCHAAVLEVLWAGVDK